MAFKSRQLFEPVPDSPILSLLMLLLSPPPESLTERDTLITQNRKDFRLDLEYLER